MNAHTRTLKPLGMPKGMDPREWRQSVEKRLNDLLDGAMSLITALDLMEADCDLEDGADDEPSLGWTLAGRLGETCDLEQDTSDDEPDSEGEPMLGAAERHPTSRESPWGRSGELTVSHYGNNSQDDWAGQRATAPSQDECEAENEHGGDVLDERHDCGDDDEHELGWTEHVDQRKAGIVAQNTWNHPEGEPLLGWCENHGKGVMFGEPADDREGDDEREQPDFY
ncbi:hypothetical protein [Mesorhizobium sophorae]|uniref:hypothetical protein n=1 Tax=Mesorhizobium sophorae TaxID=1300294 RepID=UPI00117C3CA8|nr:hypothetical protein [Mesorhizobium sophorae]